MLAIEQGYTDEYILPLIIKQQIDQTKIFQLYFRTRGTLINTIVAQIFDDDEAKTPPPPIALDPITLDPKMVGSRHQVQINSYINI